MVTGRQLQAARILAGLGLAELSAQASLTPIDLERLEGQGGSALPADDKAVSALLAVLARAGVAFQNEAGGEGVLLRPAPGKVDEGLRPDQLNAGNDD